MPKLIFWGPYVLSDQQFWNTASESQMGEPLTDMSAKERNSDFFKNNFKADKWPRTDHLNFRKI